MLHNLTLAELLVVFFKRSPRKTRTEDIERISKSSEDLTSAQTQVSTARGNFEPGSALLPVVFLIIERIDPTVEVCKGNAIL